VVEDKKTEEFAILEIFRDVFPDFPRGLLSPSESPDFILSLGPKKKIGIELTRLSQQLPDSNPFSFENISACLLTKEPKLRLYKKKRLSEYWLILVVRDPAYTPRHNLNNKLIKWVFASGFNRVFLFYLARSRVYELYTG
jgi:hypothetical protein